MAQNCALRILIMDNDKDVAASMQNLLQLLGHEACYTLSGKEALKVGANFHPDVMLLDLKLSDMSGYEVAHTTRLSAWGKAAKLIAITGQIENESRLKQSSFDSYLIKPVDLSKLRSLLTHPRT